jgi:alkanesulfonate monooxygenase SsuD/methylene tetrahydromethanopterin reductase-like flavin-dependent oxidoreductase (luciferase family)
MTPARVGYLVPPAVIARPHDERKAMLDLAIDAGVDHLAVGDHVSFYVGAGFDGLVHATGLLAAQTELPVTVAVYLLALRHPVTVARAVSSIAEIAPGRLTLGVGVGGEDRHEIELCGVDPSTRGARTDECLSVLRALASGERIDFHGDHFQLEGAQIVPAPDPSVPIVIGGRTEAAIRRSGELGDGWLGIWVSPARFAAVAEQIRCIADAAGRTDPPTRHQMNVWCGLGPDSRTGRERVAGQMEALYATPFERFERYVPCGTPAMVAERLAEYVDAGCTAFNLIVPDDDPRRAIEHVGEVAALLRS